MALSLAGQGMLYYGFASGMNYALNLAELSAALAIVLYVLYPTYLSRIITCLASLQMTLWWLKSGNYPSSTALLAFWVFHLGGVIVCLLPAKTSRQFAALGYAAAISLACWELGSLLEYHIQADHHLSLVQSLAQFSWRGLATAVAVIVASIWAAGGLGRFLTGQTVVFSATALTLLVLIALGSTGVLLALLLVLIGFSIEERPLLGLGLALLPIFIVDYYYNLEADLLTKSIILTGSGAALLALRSVLMRYAFQKEVA